MTCTLTWHGHANFQIDTTRHTVLIDPWFDGNPSARTASASIKKCDLILLTHDHGDHLGQTVEIAQATGAKVGCIVETAASLMEQGVPQSQILNGIGFNIGGVIPYLGLNIHMVQAEHSSTTGRPVGYIITLEDGFTFYHSGDTGIFATMAIFSELYDIDVAMLPIGRVFTMDPHQAALACKMLRCRKVAPMHWGTFPILEQSTEAFAEELDKIAPRTSLINLKPGQSIVLNK